MKLKPEVPRDVEYQLTLTERELTMIWHRLNMPTHVTFAEYAETRGLEYDDYELWSELDDLFEEHGISLSAYKGA